MAKIKHHNFLNTVYEVYPDTKQAVALHFYAGDQSFSGKNIDVGGRKLYHSGTKGYLGLEQLTRLKTVAMDKYAYFQANGNFIVEVIRVMEVQY
ncbi:hypothetical protein [Allomuricauda sp. F6463D]|uniref:hypothetical protein n=1 Tax=Allomuricauda sp. F6463D TaxID=2926409 RepID=UPI001FF4E739|nr:hypothetical protein [Muricauda sp. F6463D]MCK0159052.1 hypothetical protein [Muricauda sp. F6463D]